MCSTRVANRLLLLAPNQPEFLVTMYHITHMLYVCARVSAETCVYFYLHRFFFFFFFFSFV